MVCCAQTKLYFLGSLGRPVVPTGNVQVDARNARRRQNRSSGNAPRLGRPLKGEASEATLQARRRRAQIKNIEEVNQLWAANHPESWKATVACLAHPAGKRAFPEAAKVIEDAQALSKVISFTKEIGRSRKKGDKNTFKNLLSNIGAKEAVRLGFRPRRVSACQVSAPEEKEEASPSIDADIGDDVFDYEDKELELYLNFFESKTIVSSGAKTTTRILRLSHKELFFQLYAEYPARLRTLYITHGELATWCSEHPNKRFAKHLLQSVAAATDPKFNVHEEQTLRLQFITHKYEVALEKERERASQSSKIMGAKKKATSTTATACLEDVCPVSNKTFWRYMRELKQQGKIKWTTNYKPYGCRIHENGPEYVEELEHEKKLTSEGVPVTSDRKKKLKFLQKKVDKYEIHLQQYEQCRPYVEKIISNLGENECLIFRDFVNQYNERGSKINNLVLVLIERIDEVTLRSKISNFCSDVSSQSCDKDFVADVFEFHLAPKGPNGSGLLSRFNTIYISGDHGPHFSSVYTIFNESRMMTRYQKRFHIISLCSYHCYNSCDAAGAETKTVARRLSKGFFSFFWSL